LVEESIAIHIREGDKFSGQRDEVCGDRRDACPTLEVVDEADEVEDIHLAIIIEVGEGWRES
jgi:hypothetical protein